MAAQPGDHEITCCAVLCAAGATVQEMTMRTLFLVLATASAATAFSAAPAAAEQTYPWCAQYAEAGTNCGFLTLQQCNEAVSGNGGWCDHNVFIEPNV